jgi:hypothetical protein
MGGLPPAEFEAQDTTVMGSALGFWSQPVRPRQSRRKPNRRRLDLTQGRSLPLVEGGWRPANGDGDDPVASGWVPYDCVGGGRSRGQSALVAAALPRTASPEGQHLHHWHSTLCGLSTFYIETTSLQDTPQAAIANKSLCLRGCSPERVSNRRRLIRGPMPWATRR